MLHDVLVDRPVRLPRRLLEACSDSDLRVWSSALAAAPSTWTRDDLRAVDELLIGVAAALARELDRRAGKPVERGTDDLTFDLGDIAPLIGRPERNRIAWLIDGAPGGERPGLGADLPLSHPIRLILEGVARAAIRAWSDGVDTQRAVIGMLS